MFDKKIPGKKTSTKITSEKQSCNQKRCQENFLPKKRCKGTSPKNLCTETFTENKGRSPPQKTRWISITKKKNICTSKIKKDAPKKTWTETVYQKTLKNPYQNISEERSLPKNFRRDISTKRISEDNFIPKTNRETVLPKNLTWNIFAKKTAQRTLCNFSKRNLYERKLKRYLYVKIREEKSLPKNV